MPSKYEHVKPPEPVLPGRVEYLVMRYDPQLRQWLPPRPAVKDEAVAKERLRTWRKMYPLREFRLVAVETSFKIQEDA